MPKSTQEELDQLMAESAPLQAFIEQCCDVDLKKGVQKTALYDLYRGWMRSESPDAELLSDGQFATELRSAVHSIAKDRATKPNQRERKGCQIVETEFDNPSVRAGLWLGICPKMEWRSRRAFGQ
jgi:phage/plasmid-associated DNA primase